MKKSLWEREHFGEIIKAIEAGYTWEQSEACWYVTKNGEHEPGTGKLAHLLETNTELNAMKWAVEQWKNDTKSH